MCDATISHNAQKFRRNCQCHKWSQVCGTDRTDTQPTVFRLLARSNVGLCLVVLPPRLGRDVTYICDNDTVRPLYHAVHAIHQASIIALTYCDGDAPMVGLSTIVGWTRPDPPPPNCRESGERQSLAVCVVTRNLYAFSSPLASVRRQATTSKDFEKGLQYNTVQYQNLISLVSRRWVAFIYYF